MPRSKQSYPKRSSLSKITILCTALIAISLLCLPFSAAFGPAPITVYGFVFGSIDAISIETDIERKIVSLEEPIDGAFPYVAVLTLEDSFSRIDFSLHFYQDGLVVYTHQLSAQPWEMVSLNITLPSYVSSDPSAGDGDIHDTSPDHSSITEDDALDDTALSPSASYSSILTRPNTYENQAQIQEIFSDLDSADIEELERKYPLQKIDSSSLEKQAVDPHIDQPYDTSSDNLVMLTVLALTMLLLSLMIIRHLYSSDDP